MPSPAADGAAAATYVYGVVPAGSVSREVLAQVDGVAPGRPVELVERHGLAAVVSAVPLSEFAEEALAARLQDAAWLAQRARAHGRVLDAALEAGAVVPFRFGAIFRARNEVGELLAARAPELKEQLARVTGKVELGVKAFAPRDLAAGLRASHPEAQRLEAELQAAPPGRRYLLTKQLEQLLSREAAAARARIAEESHASLAARAAAAVANPLREPALERPDGTEEMLLNGAYLVSAAAQEELVAEAGRLEQRYAELRIRFEVTGPWPPFNFVEGEAA